MTEGKTSRALQPAGATSRARNGIDSLGASAERRPARRSTDAPADPDVCLYIPHNDEPDPAVSIVVPAMNEELTITDFVAWCSEGLARSGMKGEVLIIDSSTDHTAERALAAGARVLSTPKRGLGRAYIDALPFIRGRYVIMGDADCTYDFRLLDAFAHKFEEGYEFVMGSRWLGSIEPGAMPALHRYLGTPVTTWVLNFLYHSKFTDIHCGMRGMTRDALRRLDLRSQSWEYASEMVLKSVHMQLRTAEVPVRFLKDPDGRVSHHKRIGWYSPFQAAWINLRAMFVYGAEFFLIRPGLVLFAIGLLLTLPVTGGPLQIGPVTFSLYWMLLGMTLSIVGLQSFYLGCVAQILHDYTGAARRRWLAAFPYTRTVAICAVLFLGGVALTADLLVQYLRSGLVLHASESRAPYFAVTGLLLLVLAFMTFTSMLVIHASSMHGPNKHGSS